MVNLGSVCGTAVRNQLVNLRCAPLTAPSLDAINLQKKVSSVFAMAANHQDVRRRDATRQQKTEATVVHTVAKTLVVLSLAARARRKVQAVCAARTAVVCAV